MEPGSNHLQNILVVERIEPALAYWDRLGLARVMEAPEGEWPGARLGFAILAGGGIEVMGGAGNVVVFARMPA
ncbi:MAG: hypothetical protein QM767_18125 [Anaeromyxobacter sp.]